MHASLKPLLLICSLILSATLGSLTAQSATETVAFRTVGWNSNVQGLYYSFKGEYIPLKIGESAISGFFQYTRSTRLPLYKMRIDPETGREIYYVDKEVAVPSSNQFLLVFFGSANDPSLYRALAFNDSIDNIGSRDVLLVNFTPLGLKFSVEGEKGPFDLTPGQSRLISGRDGRHVAIRMLANRDGRWVPEYSNKLRIRDGRRYLVFFKDTSDPVVGRNVIQPVTVSENLRSLEIAMQFKDATNATGVISGGIDSFDFNTEDVEFLPDQAQ